MPLNHLAILMVLSLGNISSWGASYTHLCHQTSSMVKVMCRVQGVASTHSKLFYTQP